MKTTALLAFAFCLPIASYAQMPGKAVQEYKTHLGTVLHPGDTLRLSRGSNPNGSFIYAYIPARPFGGPRVYFNTSWANGLAVIKELRYQELNKAEHRTIAIVKTTTVNGVVELDAAEEVGEIKTANNRPKASVADELIKLKGLLDSGAITQAEYETQKARILK